MIERHKQDVGGKPAAARRPEVPTYHKRNNQTREWLAAWWAERHRSMLASDGSDTH